ncbi:MAG: type 2 isopentenyl-diphosphate Delta-isomerase [Stygiobacter sp.]
MSNSKISARKKEHIEICLTDKILFDKSNGFENYIFPHNAITEVDINKIDLSLKFFDKKINLPFLISCMTGGTNESERINEKLAIVASELNIPIGVGSQRQALESQNLHSTYKVVRKNAKNVPVLGNIGAAQVADSKNIVDEIKFLIDLVEADSMVIHLNPLQELFQKEGETNFKGLLNNLEKLTSKISIPFIAKEVGSGISKDVAKKLLNVGIQGIDVAGSGGTSWAKVELIRNKMSNEFFGNWGLPTSYCVRTVSKLKKEYKFVLISSGGITNGIEIAKSIALGADLSASARIILKEIINKDVDSVKNLIINMFNDVKKIMYLTGCQNLKELKKIKLIKKSELF